MQHPQSQSQTPAHINIQARQPPLNFSHVPKVWLANPINSHFMNALSILIPASEQLVNRIMRTQLDGIQDTKLKQEVKNLIRQEGSHWQAHQACNTQLKKVYPALTLFERIQKKCLAVINALSSKAFKLATPAAFEHMTAAISKDYLQNSQRWHGNKQNQATQLLLWHSLEELEHMSVCLDVYNSQYTNNFRVSLVLVCFWLPLTFFGVFAIQLYLLHKDRVIYKPKFWRKYVSFWIRTTCLLSKGSFKYTNKNFKMWHEADQALYLKSLATFNKHNS